jgi:uncharacterized protein (DUF983 family)
VSGEPRHAPATPNLLFRGLRLLCPACGKSKIFKGWFTMHETCPHCGRRFDRGPGYLLGSIYFNYGVTALLVVVVYFSLFYADWLGDTQLLIVSALVALLFPVWFFRCARSLWIAFDERWDPWPNEEERRQLRGEDRGVNSE